MQTVNFNCAHCGNLMAVGNEHLGQQVRCPHCQQVIKAPASNQAPASMSETAQRPSGMAEDQIQSIMAPGDDESIFTPQREGVEDLFGESGHRQAIEMPADTTPWAPTGGQQSNKGSGLQDFGDGGFAPTMAYNPSQPPAPAAQAGDMTEATFNTLPRAESSNAGDGTTTEFMSDPNLGLPSPPIQRPKDSSMFATTALIFLIPYSIFITLVAVFFYFQMKRVPSPLEMLQDNVGDNPGASRKAPRSAVFQRIPPDTKLPAQLRVALGQSIQVGDLKIIPEKIEQKPIVFCSEKTDVNPEPSSQDALVLTLRLENTSVDDYFVPNDPAFNTKWREGDTKPYDFLEVGSKRFYGGPIKWKPRGKVSGYRDADPREYIQGLENINKILKPGEQETTIICTDPTNPEIVNTVPRYPGQIVWRVQLRRGLVEVGDREVSATAVIGIEFQGKDVKVRG